MRLVIMWPFREHNIKPWKKISMPVTSPDEDGRLSLGMIILSLNVLREKRRDRT
jgi:hypothetical protein